MKRILVLLFFGLFLTGCYSNSLTMVGPATGVASGKVTESALSSSFNYAIKKQTGKTATEHILSESQNRKIAQTKAKINPCKTNESLCAMLKTRVNQMQKKLSGKNLQAKN